MEQDNRFLGTEKIGKLLLKFAIPCVASLLVAALYNIVDQIFIGNSEIGYLGNAATSIVFPITVIAMAFAWCFGDGAAAYLSLCQGRKDTKNVHQAIGNAMLWSVVVSIVLVAAGFIFEDQILTLFGASEATLPLARDYFQIILAFMPVFMLGNTMNGAIRADGAPNVSMAATVVGAVANIILDPVAIFALGMGIKGAAWATIIGQVLTLLIEVVYFMHAKTFKIKWASLKLNFALFKNVLKLGVSTFITQLSVVVISLVCNLQLARFGAQSVYGADIPIATIGICMKVFSIVLNIAVGVAVGAQPILGYNIGAKKYARVREAFRKVATITIIVGLVGTVVFELCPEVVIRMFGSGDELYMEFAVMTFRIFLLMITATSLIKVISIFFQSVGKPVQSAVVSLVRDIACLVPLVLILPIHMGVVGVLWAAPIADAISLVIAIILTVRFFKTLGTNQRDGENVAAVLPSRPGFIVTISREHGSQGKYIGKLVADKLKVPYYYKELTALAAKESGLDRNFVNKLDDGVDAGQALYLTNSPVKYAVAAQDQILHKIADEGAAVIVGRAADYVLRNNPKLVRVFISAPKDLRVKNVMRMYGDTEKAAEKNINRADKNRANYYRMISGQTWGDAKNYDLCIDSSIGAEETAKLILEYVEKREKVAKN